MSAYNERMGLDEIVRYSPTNFPPTQKDMMSALSVSSYILMLCSLTVPSRLCHSFADSRVLVQPSIHGCVWIKHAC